MTTYVYLDVSKKQEFIFRNNKLKENIYNSLIIKTITEIDEDFKTIDFLPVKLMDFYKENEGEKVYSGGGNSILKFEEKEKVEKFIKCYSKNVFECYPELELYISHFTPQNEEESKFKYIRKELHALADLQKDTRKSRFRRISYGIEKIDEVGRPVSFKEVKTKEEIRKSEDAKFKKAKDYFENTFLKKLNNVDNMLSKIKITNDLEDYKKTTVEKEDNQTNNKLINHSNNQTENTSKNYIGVISIDGNKMGEIVDKIECPTMLSYVGEEIDKLYSAAIAKAIINIVGDEKENKKPLLITPIVFAGDDICIITEAEKSISLASEILSQIQELSQGEAFNNKYENLNGLMKKINIKYLTACGGVSIVKAGYPFFEAVELAEEMCKNAKIHTHKLKCKNEINQDNQDNQDNQENNISVNASFIDWTVIKGGKRETQDYQKYVGDNNKNSKFSIKPLYVLAKNCTNKSFYQDDVFTYQGFKKILDDIKKQMKTKNAKLTSSGVQKIKEAMYVGEDRYKMLLEMNQIVLEDVLKDTHTKNGILDNGKEKIYILRDIIEALDFFETEEANND